MVSRRTFLRSMAAMAAVGPAGCAREAPGSQTVTGPADGSPTRTGSPSAPTDDGLPVELVPVARGFTSPIDVAFAHDGIYVADQPGVIYRITDEGSSLFHDLRDRIVNIGGYSERGLLGLALHPEFDDTRRMFVRYSAPRRSGTPTNYSHTFVLAELKVTDDGSGVVRGSERSILEVPQPQSNHNAGAIAFGPDGLLYVGTGDGGGANDTGAGHVEDWYGATAGGNGQDVTENLLGSVLRIDIDRTGDDRPYTVPPDNPLVGSAGLDEHFAWGFRNPWRFSFTGEELYVADVGQNRYEEVNLVERGGNYGWNVREGAHCFGSGECPLETPDGRDLVDPIIEYPHSGEGPSGIAVIGGVLYTGEAIPGLQDRYVFGDWQANGRLFVASRPEKGRWPATVMEVDNPGTMQFLLAFGRDEAGELYACTTAQGRVTGQSGGVYRLESA